MRQDVKQQLITYIIDNQEKFYRLAYSYVHDREEAMDVVQNAIQSTKTKNVVSFPRNNFPLRSFCRGVACLVGICLVSSMIAVNTSQVAAATLSELPIVGSLMKVLTVREYHYVDDDMEIQAEVPGVILAETQTEIPGTTAGETTEISDVSVEETSEQTLDTGAGQTVSMQDVNALIEQHVNEYIEDAKQHIAEYKDAFLATGGTEEQFQQKNIKVDVNYEMKSQSDKAVSFVITANESWSGAYGVQYFYNINPVSGEEITLADLLGKDYETIANEQIVAQMKEQMANDSSVFYWVDDPTMGGFEGITENTHFYINEAGNPVVVFEKYEVAPGAMGRPEFEIIAP